MIVPPVSPIVSPEMFDEEKWSMHTVELNEQNTQNTDFFRISSENMRGVNKRLASRIHTQKLIRDDIEDPRLVVIVRHNIIRTRQVAVFCAGKGHPKGNVGSELHTREKVALIGLKNLTVQVSKAATPFNIDIPIKLPHEEAHLLS